MGESRPEESFLSSLSFPIGDPLVGDATPLKSLHVGDLSLRSGILQGHGLQTERTDQLLSFYSVTQNEEEKKQTHKERL